MLVVVLAGCELITTRPTSGGAAAIGVVPTVEVEGMSQLDTLNAAATGKKKWFANVLIERKRLAERFDGELSPHLAAYLESNIYVYEDEGLQSYLVGIKDRLLRAWEGPALDIDIVVESDTRFNAYVDATSQLHISTGLLDSLDNEDELAAVIAHELAHLLYRHTTSRAGFERFGSLVEAVGANAMTIAVDGRVSKEEGVRAIRRLTKSGQVLGLLWSDLLVPKRSRETENQADRLGLDLLVRAGYNPNVFDKVLLRIQGAARVRTKRVTLIEGMAKERLSDVQSDAQESIGTESAAALAKVTASLLDNALGFADDFSKRYEDSDARITSLALYRDKIYNDDELPPLITEDPYLVATGKQVKNSTLKADLESIRSIIALAEKDSRKAQRLFKSASDNIDGPVDLLSINLARASLEISERRYSDARTQLEALILDIRAPVEAYLRLARLQAYQKDFDVALATLDTGTRRIGRDYRFLPTRIYIEKLAGKSELAAKSTERCAHYDAGKTRLTMEMLGGIAIDPNSYYAECVAILGRDPVADKLKDKQKEVQDVITRGCDLLAKLGLEANCS